MKISKCFSDWLIAGITNKKTLMHLFSPAVLCLCSNATMGGTRSLLPANGILFSTHAFTQSSARKSISSVCQCNRVVCTCYSSGAHAKVRRAQLMVLEKGVAGRIALKTTNHLGAIISIAYLHVPPSSDIGR